MIFDVIFKIYIVNLKSYKLNKLLSTVRLLHGAFIMS